MSRIPSTVDAIVLCLSGTGLSVARSLGRKGLSVAGIDPRGWEIGHFSRYVASAKELSVAQVARLAGNNRPVLFACGDQEILWALKHRSELSPLVKLPPSISDGTAATAVNKRTFYAHCCKHNIRIARTWIPTSWEDCNLALEEADYPLLVKPALTHSAHHQFGTDKLKVCQSASEARRWITDPKHVVLQEHIDGPESELLVYATNVRSDGSFGPEITARKLRQWPRNHGSGTRIVVEDHDDVVEHSRALIRSLGYQGICGLEWKRNSSGELVHIETNARPVLWFSLCDAIVLDSYVELAQQTALTGRLSVPGEHWQYLVRDLVASPLDALRLGQVFCVAATDDPLPGLMSPLHAAAQFLTAR